MICRILRTATLEISRKSSLGKNLQKSPDKFISARSLVTKSPIMSSGGAVNDVPGPKCRELSEMSDDEVRSWVESFDTVMTDCDGVLWMGPDPIPGSPDMVRRFRQLGKRVFYVTNNSTKHRREYKVKVDKLGFGGELEEIIGSSYLAAVYLEKEKFDKSKLVYVVGSKGITQELEDVGIECIGEGPDPLPQGEGWSLETLKFAPLSLDPRVGAVVAGFDINISFNKILKGASYANQPGVLFVATNTDEQFPMKGTGLIIPGTGAMVKAVSTAAGREPFVVGKPNRFMFDAVAMQHPSIKPERTLMIGDRCNTDILLGKNCGLQTLLVGSGVHSLQETRAWEQSQDPKERELVADVYMDKLGDLLERVKKM